MEIIATKTERIFENFWNERGCRYLLEDVHDATHSTNGRCDTTCFGCLPAARVLTALTSLKGALPHEKKTYPPNINPNLNPNP